MKRLSLTHRRRRLTGTECVAMREGHPWHGRQVVVIGILWWGWRQVRLQTDASEIEHFRVRELW
jgi:hypothetical protein